MRRSYMRPFDYAQGDRYIYAYLFYLCHLCAI